MAAMAETGDEVRRQPAEEAKGSWRARRRGEDIPKLKPGRKPGTTQATRTPVDMAYLEEEFNRVRYEIEAAYQRYIKDPSGDFEQVRAQLREQETQFFHLMRTLDNA